MLVCALDVWLGEGHHHGVQERLRDGLRHREARGARRDGRLAAEPRHGTDDRGGGEAARALPRLRRPHAAHRLGKLTLTLTLTLTLDLDLYLYPTLNLTLTLTLTRPSSTASSVSSRPVAPTIQASGRPTGCSASRRSTRSAAICCCATTTAAARTRRPTPRCRGPCATEARPRARPSRALHSWASATPARRCSSDSR